MTKHIQGDEMSVMILVSVKQGSLSFKHLLKWSLPDTPTQESWLFTNGGGSWGERWACKS